ncbi:MAG: prenyltransferase/squalene oxidase repeat-containing protein [Gemmataceae bacterium]
MSSAPFSRPRKMMALLCCAIGLTCSASVGAEVKPLSKDEQDRIDKAIDRGVEFLKGAQTEKGGWKWGMYRDGRFQAAQCALPAYALLEAGVPANDAVIQKAAEYVRARAKTRDFTYEVSLILLFLDRLGDAQDKKLIRTLAARLIAGQHHTGGWSYRTPILDEKGEQGLLKLLEQVSTPMKNKGQTREQALQGVEIPLPLRELPIFRSAADLIWSEPPASRATIADSAARFSAVGRTDNSNTQFAMLGLWAAQRHGVPVEPTFEIMTARFERSHVYPSGAWWYTLDEEGGTRSMVCVGLMGLAIGRGLQLGTPGSALGLKKDVHVLKGMAALSRRIPRPSGQMDRIVPFIDLYFLWSVERVAMLYNLTTIGDKDWYRWGAESLVTNQSKGGWWTGMSTQPEWTGKLNYDYKAALTTAFALLFLKRSHPMKELTPILPLTGELLNQGIARLRPEDKFPVRATPTTAPSRSRGQSEPRP